VTQMCARGGNGFPVAQTANVFPIDLLVTETRCCMCVCVCVEE
jgi:hypothetical protein